MALIESGVHNEPKNLDNHNVFKQNMVKAQFQWDSFTSEGGHFICFRLAAFENLPIRMVIKVKWQGDVPLSLQVYYDELSN